MIISKDPFTPLESPSIYAGDDRIRKHQLLIEGRVKALTFLTGFASLIPNQSVMKHDPM
jgi:hypothetical protein